MAKGVLGQKRAKECVIKEEEGKERRKGEKREKLRGKMDEGGGAGVLKRRACAGSTLAAQRHKSLGFARALLHRDSQSSIVVLQ